MTNGRFCSINNLMSSRISFLKSAVLPKDFPVHKKKEVAFIGRSNAGKSSLINNLAKNQKLAKVSQTPGKTRLLNFFDFPNYVLVDMPGYGYASRSGDEVADWRPMIEGYLKKRANLVGLVLVMDVRRDWSADEKALVKFAQLYNLPVLVALTKIDKVKKSEQAKLLSEMKKEARVENLFLISNTDKKGFEVLEEYIFREWIQKEDEPSENNEDSDSDEAYEDGYGLETGSDHDDDEDDYDSEEED